MSNFVNYVHLHTHSQYSLLDGACRLDAVIDLAKSLKMPALAITDHGNMFGAIEFYKLARKKGIKPILGCEAYVAGGSRLDKKPSNKYPDGGFHLVLLVKNEIGYRNLVKLCSTAYLDGFYHRPRIDKEVLRQHSEGLIATSACLKGEVNWNLGVGNTDGAVAAARELAEIFGPGNFYLEIQNHGLDKEIQAIPKMEAIARETGLPLVVTNDCHYLRQQDAEAHDALLCIQTGKLVEDRDRMRYSTDQIYFKSADEMEMTFGDHKEAMQNTVAIAESCNLEIELGKLKLPIFPIPKPFVDADVFLRHLCDRGLIERYGAVTPELQERLDYELGVIKQMGYAGYFLIVKDFCDYARSQSIRVGPGRGSAAGSIVSYVLKITDVDPIKFGLLFERFLNPERISMPDIDIDFADRGRDRIIQYVIEKYGKENVSQIITFGTMAARGVIRDVGRVLNLPYGEVDRIAKMIPMAADMTLSKALEVNSELAELKKKDQRIDRLINYGITLEGLARHCSTHAAGVVIAPSALTNYVPLFKGSNDEITTQYDMTMVEEIGLLKMDFLGLRTLTVIDDTLALLRLSQPDAQVDIDHLSLEDPEVYKLFARGETVGIFQFESGGMRDYMRRLGPTAFTDLAVMNALYRPGPLDAEVDNGKGQKVNMIDIYIERKKGTMAVTYLHPRLESILGSTYGVIVFQEQVLQIANQLAGYSLGQADLLRKAMGKKIVELMAAQKKQFVDGCAANSVTEDVANHVWEQIETFARYGFNKAHSVSYAYVAYQTAWLKRYYPREFLAATMTSEITDSDRIYILLEEARRMGISVLPPDVNSSQIDFSVVGGAIRLGLHAVKNVGETPARSIVMARELTGPFKDMADLCARIEPRQLNRRTLESLISAGACDSLPGNRAQKYTVVEQMLEYGHKVFSQANTADLFATGGVAVSRVAPVMPIIDEWPTNEKLGKEKEMLGFYISGHPLDRYRDELGSFTTGNVLSLKGMRDSTEVTVGGIFSAIKKMTDKKGNLMAFATLEDFSGSVEVIIFSECYDRCRDQIEVDKIALVTGRVSTREGETAKLVASQVHPLEKLLERFKCQLVIKVNVGSTDNLDKALSSLAQYPGDTPVLIAARQNGTEVYIKSRKYAVNLNLELLNRLKELLGDSSAYLRPLSVKDGGM